MSSPSAGTAYLRSVARRAGRVIATSGSRTIAVQAAPPPTPPTPPTPPPPPPLTEPTVLPDLTGVYPPSPPNVPLGSGVTNLLSWQAGEMLCSRGATTLRVTYPSLQPTGFHGYYDYYVDVVFRWDGTNWQAVSVSPWAYQARGFVNSWYYLANGQHVSQNVYQVSAEYRYAVAQYLYDGQYGGYWQPLFATYLTVGGGLNAFICRPG
ncbi:hypothetical protein GON03_18170 [Nocardioides sp. MAH-18]|uniref:Uncharacterized protein n=1 Tax=Nocardioides agri TaxID=2682843 RepID=A0A6L6XUM9_9ACTN|nr:MULTISPECIES: hypothetical protein [unclassified Nocardioides]MBA2956268.1 hypothetical protein [Nocardioides sp. CGMCC 1.13656]MVQ51111.1 hypothetical protein [Nocardioides sp. MAH-18]